MQLNENELIKKFLSHKTQKSFMLIYEQHAAHLLRTAMYLMRNNKELAEDLIQETWIVAIRKLDDFEGRSLLKTWLTGILYNKYREYMKQCTHDNIVTETLLFTGSNNVIDLKIDLKNAVMLLPDGYREVLTLYDIQGFKHKEIAEVLGIHEGTSKSQLAMARQKLRTILDNYKRV